MRSLAKRMEEWVTEDEAIHAIYATLGVCNSRATDVRKQCPSFFDDENWAALDAYRFLNVLRKIGCVEKSKDGDWKWCTDYIPEDFAHGVESSEGDD